MNGVTDVDMPESPDELERFSRGNEEIINRNHIIKQIQLVMPYNNRYIVGHDGAHFLHPNAGYVKWSLFYSFILDEKATEHKH